MNRILRAAMLLPWAALIGCATDDTVVRILPEDTAWIQRGQTTREQVIVKFGEPRLILNNEELAGQLAEYLSSPTMQSYGQRGGSQVFVPLPQGSFPQVYPSAEQAGRMDRELQPLGDRFWLRYDAQGIVQDFGFGKPSDGH